MDEGNMYVYDFSELREDVQTFSQQNREQNETIISQFDTIQEQNETIITQFNSIYEQQSDIIIQNMLIIGLLGILIGICFVNIFKSR